MDEHVDTNGCATPLGVRILPFKSENVPTYSCMENLVGGRCYTSMSSFQLCFLLETRM